MRRTNSDGGGGAMGSVGPLTTSNSFPSLSDTVLRQLGALMEDIKNKEEHQSSEKDIENKFTSLMLAFKTDKVTLEQRAEAQRRQRDQVEANIASEISHIKECLQVLSPLCTDSEKIELLENVNKQMDILHKATLRASTVLEMYGAVMQEKRLSRAVEIVLRHVENLKQAYDKERTDHEETRRVLVENKIPTSAVLKLQNSKRRASIATLTRAQTSPDPNRSPSLPGEGRTMSRARLGSLPRKLSNTIHEAEPEETNIKDTSTGSNNSTANSTKGDVGEVSSSTRTVQRKSSSQAIGEERRQSQSATVAESESEDDECLQDASSEIDQPPFPSKDDPIFNMPPLEIPQDSWLTQIMDWLRLRDHALMRVRIAISVTLGIVALAVIISPFIPKR